MAASSKCASSPRFSRPAYSQVLFVEIQARLRKTSDPTFEICRSEMLSSSARNELLDLCSRAYEEDFSAYLRLLDPAVHLFARCDGMLVSHVAWVERPLMARGVGRLRCAYVEAVATAPEHRGRGFATALMARIPSLVGEFDIAALSPSDDRFYRRLGWEMWLGPLSYLEPSGQEVPTPEEQVMIYRLPRTPASLDTHAKLSTTWRPLEVW